MIAGEKHVALSVGRKEGRNENVVETHPLAST